MDFLPRGTGDSIDDAMTQAIDPLAISDLISLGTGWTDTGPQSHGGSVHGFPGTPLRLNDFDYGSLTFASSADFYDLEGVALERGPRVALFNANFAGLVGAHWREPGEFWEAAAETDVDDDGRWRMRGLLNAPLSGGDERANGRVVLEHAEDETSSHYSARVSLSSAFGDGHWLLLRAFGEEDGFAAVFPLARGVDRDFYGAEGELGLALPDVPALGETTLSVRGGWRRMETNGAVISFTPPGSIERFDNERWAANAQAWLRAGSRDSVAEVSAGFLWLRDSGSDPYRREIEEGLLALTVRPLARRPPSDNARALELFGAVRFGESRFRTLGSPLVVPQPVIEFERSPVWSEAGVSYRFSLEQRIYAKYVHVRDEDADAAGHWELAWQSLWLDKRATLSAALFRGSQDRGGPVLRCSSPVPPGLPCPTPVRRDYPFDPNVLGVDLDFDVEFVDPLYLSGGVSYLLANQRSRVNDSVSESQAFGAPRWSAFALARYRISLGESGALLPLLRVAWSSLHFGGGFQRQRTLDVDARLRWASPRDRFWVEGYVTNAAEGMIREIGSSERRYGVRLGFGWERDSP